MEITKSLLTKTSVFLLVGLCLALLYGPVPGHAADTATNYVFYVDVAGNDEANGTTAATAWKTLHHAIAQINIISAEPGDTFTLYVKPGTYSATENGESNESLTITQSNVTIDGDETSKPIVDASGAGSWPDGLEIAASNVTVKDLIFQNFAAASSGIRISDGSNNIIENCEFHRNQYGVHILSPSSGNEIRSGCKIHDNYQTGIYIYGSDDNLIYDNIIYDNASIGIHLQSENVTGGASPDNNKIYNNNFYWTDTIETLFGIQFSRDDWIFEGTGNEIYENEFHGPSENTSYHTAIHIYPGATSTKISRNKMYNLYKGIYSYYSDAEVNAPQIVNNLIYNVEYGIYLETNNGDTVSGRVYHNTVADGVYSGLTYYRGSPIIMYNIISGFTTVGIERLDTSTNAVIDYNDVFNNGTNYVDCSPGEHDLNPPVDPKFTDAANGDYTLQASSPCKDAIPTNVGDPVTDDINGTERPQGTGFDMGCYEYSGGVTPGTYYVNILSGNDANDGTSQASAWKTFHHAIAQINAGSTGNYTLNVAIGTYSVPDEADAELILRQSKVTIVGASGSGPIIDGSDAAGWTKGLTITGSDCTIQNLYITGFSGSDEMGIEFNAGSNNTVQDCTVYGNYEGIDCGLTTTGNTVTGCDIYGNTKGIVSYSDDVITPNLITQNSIHDNVNDGNGIGIHLLNSSPEISRNNIYDNSYGIFVDGKESGTVSPVIVNNLIYEKTSEKVLYGIVIDGTNTSTVNPKIHHNTIDGGMYEGVIVEKESESSSSLNPEIKYNIITNFRQYGIQNTGGSPVIDYNDVWNNATANYSGCSAGENDISADPNYGSYALLGTSPCINAIPTGNPPNDPVSEDIDGKLRPYGSGFDMGCYEDTALPAVTTSDISGITSTTALSGGGVVSEGSSAVTAKGVCWSTSPNPTVDLPTKTNDGTGTGSFTSFITGLTPGTTYYLRAYAKNDAGTGYGSEYSFTTATAYNTVAMISMSNTQQKYCPPVVAADGSGVINLIEINLETPQVVRALYYLDGALQYNRYINVASSPHFHDPFSEMSTVTLQKFNAVGVHTAKVEVKDTSNNLLAVDQKTYEIVDCSASGASLTLGTPSSYCLGSPPDSIPSSFTGVGSVAYWTDELGNVISTPAPLQGSFDALDKLPTFWINRIFNTEGFHFLRFDVTLSSPSGVYVSDTVVFNVEPCAPTLVTTQSVTGIGTTSATGNGTITSLGTPNPTAHGVCWNTTGSPAISDPKTNNGAASATGPFTSAMTGLSPSTTYYVRAYATNSAGTGYGEQVSFTTSAATPTKVELTGPSSVVAGSVSTAFTLTSQDANGNAANVTQNTTFSLTSTSGTGAFYSDPAGTISITQITIANGTSTATFYYKDTATGTPTVTASRTSGMALGSGTHQITVNSGTPTKVDLTGPSSVVAGSVSTAFTLTSQDANGNAANVTQNTVFNLTSTSGTGAFYSDPAGTISITQITIANGTSTATFYYKDTATGTPTVTASRTSGMALGSGTHQITVTQSVVPGTYYVDIVNGNDSNDGTSASKAWKTIHHALLQINSGSEGNYFLHILNGTYSKANGEADTQLVLAQSNVNIIGQLDNPPIIDGTGAVALATDLIAEPWTKGLTIEGSNCTVQDLIITGFSGYDETGIEVNAGSNNKVQRCKLYGNYQGINFGPGTSDNVLRESDIYQNNQGVVCYSDNVITQNTIHGNENGGLFIDNASPYVLRNAIYDNSYGISVSGTGTGTASPTIRNNLIYEATSGVMDFYAIHVTAIDTAVVAPTIYHNTLDGGSSDGIRLEKEGASNTLAPEIKYNIISNFGQCGINNVSSLGSPVIDYNDVWNNGSANYSPSSLKGPNDISKDPLYGSYTLQQGSPCIDPIPESEGDPVDIDYLGVKRPKGNGYDMGAYEYVPSATFNYTLPGGTGQATDYRIFTVPLDLGNGTVMLAQMQSVLGQYNRSFWRVFAYDNAGYVEIDSSLFGYLRIKPGMAFWIISVYTPRVSFHGVPAPDGDDYRIMLSPGWHLIGLPWISTQINLENIYVRDWMKEYSITNANNTLTQKGVWEYAGTSGYLQRTSSSYALQCGKGYWIKVTADHDVTLIIPRENPVGQANINTTLNDAATPSGDAEAPPPPPGAEPIPRITVNNIDGSAMAVSGTPVSVSVTLDPGAWAGRDADWWIAAHTPFAAPNNWYSYIHPQGWVPGIHRCVKVPLFKFASPYQVLYMKLPPGRYTFYFAVDGNADGKTDATWFDSVDVTVE